MVIFVKPLSLSKCQKACKEYNPNENYGKILASVLYWFEKRGVIKKSSSGGQNGKQK